ncbi:MAG: HEAT repeat domain-containing protein [Acidobacteria bacterium]|nr:HEAT repeat domain-containing protein [Acidobacteriota bacterium]
MPKIVCRLILILILAASAAAQEPGTARLLRALLDLPAPAPKTAADEIKRPESFYDDRNPPPDDAPLEDLLDYWNIKASAFYSGAGKPPTASVRTALRIVEAVREEPAKFDGFLKILPVDKEVAESVKLLFDLKQSSDDVSDSWREKVRDWLKFNSDFYVDELLADAEKARDHKEYASVVKSAELTALARLDWEKAAPVLARLENDRANLRTAVFAKTLIYEHALREKDAGLLDRLRDELEAIVENKNASGSERDLAFDALTALPDWPGFDDWYLSLFADETLLELRLSGSSTTAPLNGIVQKNPDKWIPVLTKLVGSRTRAVHNAAVNALVQFYNRDARKDALEPLLPWITDPGWAKDTGDYRLRLIQSMEDVDLPDSVPALIWVVQNDKDQYNRAYAAQSLGKYKDLRAVAVLQSALANEPEEYFREFFIRSLIACGGLGEAGQIAALESYATAILTPEGFKKIDEKYEHEEENPLPVTISIGKYLAKQKTGPETYVRAVFERIGELEKTNPAVARKLSEIANKWQGKAVDAEIIKRVADGRADLDTIVTVLVRRHALRESVPVELSWLTAKSGLAQAVGVGVFEDEAQLTSLVNQTNPETQTAALAVARLLRLKLPVRDVGALLDSTDKLLALAAERYLESEDGREARELVLARHPGEFLILGARDCFYPPKTAGEEFGKELLTKLGCSLSFYYQRQMADLDKEEESLRREMRENKDLLEIYAAGGTVLRVFGDRAVLRWKNDSAYFFEKALTSEELAAFHNSIAANKIDEMPPRFGDFGIAMGISQFVMIDRQGGRRVFAYGGIGVVLWMWTLFSPYEQGDVKPQFKFAKNIRGLEILLADNRYSPKAVWKDGGDFRVLVEDTERKREIEDELDRLDKIDDENEDLGYETRGINARRRRAEREFAAYEWRRLENGKLGGPAGEPADIPFLRDHLEFPSMENLAEDDDIPLTRSGSFVIRAGDNLDNYGLWKANRAGRTRIAEGWLKNPVTTADGKWVVASQTDTNWDDPNYLVRIDLRTGRVSKIKMPAAKNLAAVGRVPADGKILLRSADDYTDKVNPKYYLLDAETGAVREVKGVFAPLRGQTFRQLQPAGKPDEFWAAVYDGEATEIGIYDDRLFSFKPRLRLPEIALDSMQIWVDEAAKKVYFVYGDDFGQAGFLLAVPLPDEK